MKLTKTVRTFGIVAALLGTLASKSFALPTNQLETVYFSDAKYTTEVGYTVRACNGGVYTQGKTSRYRATTSTPCNGNQSLNEIRCYVGSLLTSCPTNLCDSPLFDCH
jgi:hypothetical protein